MTVLIFDSAFPERTNFCVYFFFISNILYFMKASFLSQNSNRDAKLKGEEEKKSIYQVGDRLWIPDEDHAW